MNLQHLKYAVWVAEYGSINKAADALYLSQPNLSRAIRELEQETGITIFNRTSQGVSLTFSGEEFLQHARVILDEMEQIRRIAEHTETLQRFSLCVPRAGYISNAFTRFLNQLDSEKQMLVDYKETNSIGAIQNILSGGFNLGILRYQKAAEPYFAAMLREQGLAVRHVCDFVCLAAMSRDNPLSQKPDLCYDDLLSMTEIAHGDPYLQSAAQHMPDQDTVVNTQRKIHVYDSMGQLSMLHQIPNTFMMVYPLEQEFLDRYGLVQRKVTDLSSPCRDVLIHKKEYRFSSLDKLFLRELDFSRLSHPTST